MDLERVSRGVNVAYRQHMSEITRVIKKYSFAADMHATYCARRRGERPIDVYQRNGRKNCLYQECFSSDMPH